MRACIYNKLIYWFFTFHSGTWKKLIALRHRLNGIWANECSCFHCAPDDGCSCTFPIDTETQGRDLLTACKHMKIYSNQTSIADCDQFLQSSTDWLTVKSLSIMLSVDVVKQVATQSLSWPTDWNRSRLRRRSTVRQGVGFRISSPWHTHDATVMQPGTHVATRHQHRQLHENRKSLNGNVTYPLVTRHSSVYRFFNAACLPRLIMTSLKLNFVNADVWEKYWVKCVVESTKAVYEEFT